ncbi:MAG TPA: acyltransferase [Lacunisphaera sp.]|jgi:peptidoglycan/LPS O-acetylase OafA/YrhL
MTPSRFPVLDTVRGLAFLMVVFSHLGILRGLVTIGIGQFGVWIFFVLSAFLLSRPFFEAPHRVKNSKELRTYIKHRAFRIFPPLALSVVAFCLVIPNFTWKMAAANFLCLQGYGIFWTVFVETRYYLLLPLVVAAVLSLRNKPVALFMILAAGIALNLYDCPFWLPRNQWRALPTDPSTMWLSREHLFFQYLPVFVGGTLLAALHFAMLKSSIWAKRLRRLAPIGFLAALLSFLVLSSSGLSLVTGRSISPYYYHGMWLPLLPVPCALVLFAASLTGGFERFFGNSLFRYFGKISYSGYLFHVLFVVAFNPLIPSTTLYVCAVLAATLAVATASHYLIERPFIAFSHRS